MLSLYDIVQQSLAGAGKSGLSDMFSGLSAQQTNQALSALIPAFSLGLKRMSQDPQSFLALMNLINTFPGQMPSSFAPQSPDDTMKLARRSLDMLFGPADARKSIADQAAMLAGVPSDKVLEMMPALASTIMTGLKNDMPIKEGPAAELLGAFVSGFERGRPEPRQEPDFSMEAAADMMNSFFAGFQRGREEEETEAPDLEDPATDESASPDEPTAEPSIMDSLFEAGDQVQKSHMEAMQSMFDSLYSKK